MDITIIIGQLLGFIATFFSVFSFQLKTHKQIMLCQLGAAFFFAVHYFLLGAYAGAAINGLCLIRNVVFYHKDKPFFSSIWWTVGFAVAVGLVGIGFWNTDGWYALIVMVAMMLNTVSFSLTNPQMVRVTILFSSPLLLIYNILTGSIGGLINEVLAEISTVVGLIRYKKKKPNKKSPF